MNAEESLYLYFELLDNLNMESDYLIIRDGLDGYINECSDEKGNSYIEFFLEPLGLIRKTGKSFLECVSWWGKVLNNIPKTERSSGSLCGHIVDKVDDNYSGEPEKIWDDYEYEENKEIRKNSEGKQVCLRCGLSQCREEWINLFR